MLGRTCCALLTIVAMGMSCGAQTAPATAPAIRTITVRVADGRTGEKITPYNVEIRVDRSQATHAEWVKLDGEGIATVTLPASATALSVHATFDGATEYYVNCDVAKQKDVSQDTWFPVADVLTQGLVMPNECGKARDAQKLKIEARPGEFVLLVRKQNWHDRVDQLR
ncbi:MAG TPA: hypothetical protein VE291_12590 [Terracidiphilus sp.]|jgi:hypothetical protein|nr:hypothetical protein [Terracidiphilus sp.]